MPRERRPTRDLVCDECGRHYVGAPEGVVHRCYFCTGRLAAARARDISPDQTPLEGWGA